MAQLFQLSVVTPEKVFCEIEVESLVAPGSDGYLGILAHHAPLITALTTGVIEYRDADGKEATLAVSNGFLEVSENKATILADSVESSSEIDIERAKSAEERARKRIATSSGDASDVDIFRARLALLRALNRLKVSNIRH